MRRKEKADGNITFRETLPVSRAFPKSNIYFPFFLPGLYKKYIIFAGMELNDAQREAATATEGYVRVIAGAGSGKTQTLTRRFAFLVDTLGIPPGNMLCVTLKIKLAAAEQPHDRDGKDPGNQILQA